MRDLTLSVRNTFLHYPAEDFDDEQPSILRAQTAPAASVATESCARTNGSGHKNTTSMPTVHELSDLLEDIHGQGMDQLVGDSAQLLVEEVDPQSRWQSCDGQQGLAASAHVPLPGAVDGPGWPKSSAVLLGRLVKRSSTANHSGRKLDHMPDSTVHAPPMATTEVHASVDPLCQMPGVVQEDEAAEDSEQPLLVHVDTHDWLECPQKTGWRQQPANMNFIAPELTNPSVLRILRGGTEALEAPARPAATATKGSVRPAQRPPRVAQSVRKAAGDAAVQRTTVMLRNLPNNYTRHMLLNMIDSEGFAGRYDFLYLPIDFKTHAALGYAFLNLITPEDAERVHQRLNGFTRWVLPSSKVCSISWSQPHQGLEAHIARYRSSPLMHAAVPDSYRPILFKNGIRVPFPAPTKNIKPPRQGSQRVLG